MLPANTFTSNYGKKISEFFKEKNYSIDFVIERVGPTNTFSEQCGLKEYLLIATKGLENYGETFTKLVTKTLARKWRVRILKDNCPFHKSKLLR